MRNKQYLRTGWRGRFGILVMCSMPAVTLAPVAAVATESAAAWGSYDRPFAADSLWNSRPLDAVFDSYVIPADPSGYFPTVSSGAYSTGAFLAGPYDPPVKVLGETTAGVWDPDAHVQHASIPIPHWPAGVVPGASADGHAEIVDPGTGIIHSFSHLRLVNGQWYARQYAWTRMAGTGWGDPAHYFQGARATGVSALAGLMRKHEIDDGAAVYRHALALSLPHGALAPLSHVFPATSHDSAAPLPALQNTGPLPEGARLMLPPGFDAGTISNLALRKVAQTLKLYGAYVVDRNYGTPFQIYVENGAKFSLYNGGWDNVVAADLVRIRKALRHVVSARSWVDGNGAPTSPKKMGMNLLSMRGPWQRTSPGTAAGNFDTWAQALVFPPTALPIAQIQQAGTGVGMVDWGKPQVNGLYRFKVAATGGAKLRLSIYTRTSANIVVRSQESPFLADGGSFDISWPAGGWVVLSAISGVGQASSLRGTLQSLAP